MTGVLRELEAICLKSKPGEKNKPKLTPQKHRLQLVLHPFCTRFSPPLVTLFRPSGKAICMSWLCVEKKKKDVTTGVK